MQPLQLTALKRHLPLCKATSAFGKCVTFTGIVITWLANAQRQRLTQPLLRRPLSYAKPQLTATSKPTGLACLASLTLRGLPD